MPKVGDFEKFAFIVGAPRCGTTTMSKLLQAHPEVAFPFVKEPHFFSQHDLRGLSDAELKSSVESDYLGHFFNRPEPGERVGADGSVSYLYTPEQLEPVLRLWPESRFIVGVRDPMTLLPSLHKRLIYIGDETIGSFSDAWTAVPDRTAGRRIPSRCADPRWLRYDEAGRFAEYVERLFAAVGRERCHVVLFDDFNADPEGEYRRFMEFCGLEPVIGTDFAPRRASAGVRHIWLQRILKRPPHAVRDYLAGEHFMVRVRDLEEKTTSKSTKKVLSLRKRLLRWNRIAAKPAPVPDRLADELRSHFADEVKKLGRLLDRDLSHWLGSAVAVPVAGAGQKAKVAKAAQA